MKQKSKLLTVLIAIFALGMTMSVFAADKVTLTASVTGDAENGEEITVKLDLADSQNLGGLQSTLAYDKTKLQFVSGTLTDEFKASATVGSSDVVDGESGVGIAVVFNDPSNYNGTIAEVKFKVLAQKGEAVEVNLTSELADIDYNEMTVENKPAQFTVKAPVINSPDASNKPETETTTKAQENPDDKQEAVTTKAQENAADKQEAATTAKAQENATVSGKTETGDTFNKGAAIVIMMVCVAAVGAAMLGKKRACEK